MEESAYLTYVDVTEKKVEEFLKIKIFRPERPEQISRDAPKTILSMETKSILKILIIFCCSNLFAKCHFFLSP